MNTNTNKQTMRNLLTIKNKLFFDYIITSRLYSSSQANEKGEKLRQKKLDSFPKKKMEKELRLVFNLWVRAARVG